MAGPLNLRPPNVSPGVLSGRESGRDRDVLTVGYADLAQTLP